MMMRLVTMVIVAKGGKVMLLLMTLPASGK
jgi:hypothetical protein